MLETLANEELVARIQTLVRSERGNTAQVVAHLAELDRRKLYADLGCSSLFSYCTKRLGYAEGAAAKQVYAARAVQRFPVVLPMLERGELSLAGAMILSPHLTPENHTGLLEEARGKSSRGIERIAARLDPLSAKKESIRRLSAPGDDETGGRGSTGLVRFAFTGTERFLLSLERAREVLRHKYPKGRLEEILAEALEELLERRDPERRPLPRKPAKSARDGVRRIPAWVRAEVWRRDGGSCVYADREGRRCGERGGLEFDHIVPWALGGSSDAPENVRLLCRAHNQHAARRIFGEEKVGPRH